MDLKLPPMDVAGRGARLQSALADAGVDALLITSLVNIRYLTGFTGSAGQVLVLPGQLLLVTDGRYREQAGRQLAGAGVAADVEARTTVAAQREVIVAAAEGVGRLGLEAAHISWAQQRALASDWFPATELVPTTGLVEGLRAVKDDGEVARIEAAAAAADGALAAVVRFLVTGPTERDVALALEAEMRHLGASGPSFETIVASGPNGAMPHHRPTPRRIGPGELVVIDFGATVDGYRSDMTRTVCVGEPLETARSMFDVVRAAQQAGVDAVAPGVETQAVDRACRTIIGEAGWGEAFVHGTGHGVGLEIHEDPRVGTTSSGTLTVGEVVTVEPGVYLPEHGGVRIEDTVVVTATGCRRLTNAPKDLVI